MRNLNHFHPYTNQSRPKDSKSQGNGFKFLARGFLDRWYWTYLMVVIGFIAGFVIAMTLFH